ncbi:hypothetical protein HDE_07772 [Halotydeus destructor]|nr:hypothetical protein HDE_07772 [Halotydeus destructor]
MKLVALFALANIACCSVAVHGIWDSWNNTWVSGNETNYNVTGFTSLANKTGDSWNNTWVSGNKTNYNVTGFTSLANETGDSWNNEWSSQNKSDSVNLPNIIRDYFEGKTRDATFNISSLSSDEEEIQRLTSYILDFSSGKNFWQYLARFITIPSHLEWFNLPNNVRGYTRTYYTVIGDSASIAFSNISFTDGPRRMLSLHSDITNIKIESRGSVHVLGEVQYFACTASIPRVRTVTILDVTTPKKYSLSSVYSEPIPMPLIGRSGRYHDLSLLPRDIINVVQSMISRKLAFIFPGCLDQQWYDYFARNAKLLILVE